MNIIMFLLGIALGYSYHEIDKCILQGHKDER